MAKVIAVYNKKGGCGKTTTATTLAYLLARCGKRTALIDLDSQGDSSLAYGVPNPDKLQTTILSLVKQVIIGEPLPSPSSYMYSYHGVDLVPSNEEISTLERNLSNVDFREYILKEYISQISPSYDYIIIDCMPNFDTSMLNVMVCADSVVIPTQAEYYSAIGSMKFIRNFQQIRQHANPKLEIAGILITMNQGNTNLSTQITQELERTIGNQIRIFNTRIPRSVKVAEASGYHSLIPDGGAHYGLTVTGIGNNSTKLVEALQDGKLVIALMSKGHFTNGGHFIVLRGITEDGKILVADPASVKRSNQEWELGIVVNEARRGAAAGGPFWVFS